MLLQLLTPLSLMRIVELLVRRRYDIDDLVEDDTAYPGH